LEGARKKQTGKIGIVKKKNIELKERVSGIEHANIHISKEKAKIENA
jgi:hypothetical protein